MHQIEIDGRSARRSRRSWTESSVGVCGKSRGAGRCGAARLRSQSSKRVERQVEYDTTGSNTTKTGEAGSFCIDVEICGARRCGAARA